MPRSSLRAWLSDRSDAYGRIVVTLLLNVPLLSLALARHLDSVRYVGITGLYVPLVFLGYYALLLVVLVSAVFLALALSRRLAVVASGLLLVLAVYYLVVNGMVHRVYRIHIDAFWLQYALTSYSGIGIPRSMVVVAIVLLALVVVVQWILFRVAGLVRRRGVLAVGFVLASLAAYLTSQMIHIAAYDRSDSRITSITPQLPFYYPIVSYKAAAKYGDLVPLGPTSTEVLRGTESRAFQYPLRTVSWQVPPGGRRPNIVLIVLESWRYDTMDSITTPNMYALSKRSSVFQRHFSSGNATPTGIFGMFYGIHPTYWTAVKANSEIIDNPVLIDVLQANDYEMGIFADSHFDRHKIKPTVFRGITVHERFAGSTVDQHDDDLTNQLLAFMEKSHRQGRPSFGFAFYKSTHYSYYYPKRATRFVPSHELNVVLAGNAHNLTPYLNDYRNAVAYVDELVGRIVRRLEATRMLDETVIVITSDHGEEFNDNHADYWGHTSNFTRYQTQVPMIVYVPWQQPRTVTSVTAHVDIPPTLIEEALGRHGDPGDYSNGKSLFGPLDDERPLVISSYVNHAIVMGDDVYAVYPMVVQKYKLWDIKAKAGPPRPQLSARAMDEMHRFYGGGAISARPPRRDGPLGVAVAGNHRRPRR